MREVGVEYFIISSDLGQYLNPVHTDGMTVFILGLRNEGLSEGDIDIMCRRNPAALSGLSGLNPDAR